VKKELAHIKRGIFDENPVFRLVLGMCPMLAVTTEAKNAIGMGLATMVVLIGSNCVISLFRSLIPDRVRIPVFIVVIASFVTIVELLLHAYFQAIYASLGLFIPLIVVNCLILGRAEIFASQNTIWQSLWDGFGMGLGFTFALLVLGSIREVLGAGTIFGVSVMGAHYEPFLLFVLPPGAFIALGLVLGLMNMLQNKKA